MNALLTTFTDLFSLPMIPRPSFRIFQRNLLELRYSLWLSILIALAEPVTLFLVLGFGFGHYLGSFSGHSYGQYLAAGVAAISTMMVSYTDIAYRSFARLNRSEIYYAVLQTPIEANEVAIGEILWSGLKGASAGGVVLLLSQMMGMTSSWHMIWTPFVLVMTGFFFASIGLWVAARARSANAILSLQAAILTPMALMGDTFIPVSSWNEYTRGLTLMMPLSHSSQLIRALCSGDVTARVFLNIAILTVITVMATNTSVRHFERRLKPD